MSMANSITRGVKTKNTAVCWIKQRFSILLLNSELTDRNSKVQPRLEAQHIRPTGSGHWPNLTSAALGEDHPQPAQTTGRKEILAALGTLTEREYPKTSANEFLNVLCKHFV